MTIDLTNILIPSMFNALAKLIFIFYQLYSVPLFIIVILVIVAYTRLYRLNKIILLYWLVHILQVRQLVWVDNWQLFGVDYLYLNVFIQGHSKINHLLCGLNVWWKFIYGHRINEKIVILFYYTVHGLILSLVWHYFRIHCSRLVLVWSHLVVVRYWIDISLRRLTNLVAGGFHDAYSVPDCWFWILGVVNYWLWLWL